MAGTLKRIAGPAYLTGSAANIYSPPNAAVNTVINQIHIANTDTAAWTFTLYVGGTGGSTGGTEIAKAVSVPANTTTDLFFSPGLFMASTDFLTGLASSASKLTITVLGTYVAA